MELTLDDCNNIHGSLSKLSFETFETDEYLSILDTQDELKVHAEKLREGMQRLSKKVDPNKTFIRDEALIKKINKLKHSKVEVTPKITFERKQIIENCKGLKNYDINNIILLLSKKAEETKPEETKEDGNSTKSPKQGSRKVHRKRD